MNRSKKQFKLDGKDEEKNSDKQKKGQWKKQAQSGLIYLIVNLIGLWLFQQFILSPLVIHETEISYSEFKSKIQSGQVISVTLGTDRHVGTMKNPDPQQAGSNPSVPFTVNAMPNGDTTLIQDLDKAGITYQVSAPPSPLNDFILSWGLPLLVIGSIYYLGNRQMGKSGMGAGGMGGMFGVSKSKATEVKPETIGITYKDVGGADEAIAELQETIQFLKTPEKFATLGGQIPKGVLLVGPPGTGKTLLAKATAGEAGVSFFETSGSSFMEMFVGVGAARVRDLFEQARNSAPSVIFIDEIDAIGQSRASSSRFGGNDEREQTLNQLLA